MTTPSESDLFNAVNLLNALADPTRSDHQIAMQTLSESCTNPSFIFSMLQIFSFEAETAAGSLSNGQLSGLMNVQLRQLAGLIVKNYVFINLSTLSEDIRQKVKEEIIKNLGNPVTELR